MGLFVHGTRTLLLTLPLTLWELVRDLVSELVSELIGELRVWYQEAKHNKASEVVATKFDVKGWTEEATQNLM